MSRGQWTAFMAAVAVGAFAPRLAAQDTSATRETRPDTSGYNGTAGVDTTAPPGRVGAIDTSAAGMDSIRHPRVTGPGDSTSASSDSLSDSTSASDSASVSHPSKQPGQGTSRTGDSATTGP